MDTVSLAAKRRYNVNLCMTFSTSGSWMACADCYGYLTIFSLEELLKNCEEEDGRPQNRCFRLSVSSDQINALETAQDLLFCGCCNGDIIVYSWPDLMGKTCKPVSVLRAGSGKDCFGDVNALLMDKEDPNRLYSAGADQTVYVWDVEASKIVSKWKEHESSVYCLTAASDSRILSSGEDGLVKIWDSRTNGSVNTIKPYTSECARPHLGKWICCMTTFDSWLVCGGGVSLGLWYLGACELAKQMSTDDIEWYSATNIYDSFVAAGTSGNVHRFSFEGDLMEKMRASSSCIYDVRGAPAQSDANVLVCCGNGSTIDVYKYFGFKLLSLQTL